MGYSLPELRGALMMLKKEKKFSGKPSKMKKGEIMDALKSLNFAFSTLPSYGKGVKPQRKRTVPFGPEPKPKAKRGRKPKVVEAVASLPLTYSKATGTYVKSAPTTAPTPTPAMTKVVIPKSSQNLISRLQRLKSTVAKNESAVAKIEASTPASRRRGRPPKTI